MAAIGVCSRPAPLNTALRLWKNSQTGMNFLEQSAEAKFWMVMPTKTRQSLYGKVLNTLPKEASTPEILSSCIASDSSVCEKGLFLQPR
jgi:hypothetical protein